MDPEKMRIIESVDAEAGTKSVSSEICAIGVSSIGRDRRTEVEFHGSVRLPHPVRATLKGNRILRGRDQQPCPTSFHRCTDVSRRVRSRAYKVCIY
jgi:hypothetical protein